MSMTQVTVSHLTRMVNHKGDVPNILAMVSRLARSRRKKSDTKHEKKIRECSVYYFNYCCLHLCIDNYALILGQLGCINIFSRVLKKFCNESDKSSLVILR